MVMLDPFNQSSESDDLGVKINLSKYKNLKIGGIVHLACKFNCFVLCNSSLAKML